MTRNADQEYVLLIGTESGRIKIHGLTYDLIYSLMDNQRKGIVAAHNKVVGFIAWDGSAFISVGSEGRVHVWLWKSAAPASVGAAVLGTGSLPSVPGFGGAPSTGMGGFGNLGSGTTGGMETGVPRLDEMSRRF